MELRLDCVPTRNLVILVTMSHSPVISVSTDVLGGTPVFQGTRVPIKTLFDYLESGETIESFLTQFPSVTRQQVVAVLEESKKRLLSSVA